MIGYVTIGASDFDRSVDYYTELLGTIGAKRLMEIKDFTLIGRSMEEPAVAVVRPFDGNPPTRGNGLMTAFQLDSQDAVNAFHAKALELGGTDEGAPGDRDGLFYAAYFRDLDGNKFCCFVLYT